MEESGEQGNHDLSGDPVNPLTGEYILTQTDLTVPGAGLPFSFARTYASNSPVDGPLGAKWTHTYHRTLTMNWNYSMDVRDGQGRRLHYRFVPDPEVPVSSFDGDPLIEIRLDRGYFESSVLNSNTLARNPDGTYTERTKDGIAYRYAGYWARWRGSNQSPTAGRLMDITDSNGNRLAFHYDGQGRLTEIVDTAGRKYHLTYEGSLLVELRDPAGRRLQYDYDERGRLKEVINPIGSRWRFQYDEEGRLTRYTGPRGFSMSYRYDAEGRVVEVVAPDGSLYNRFTYQRGSGYRTEYTDPRGGTTVYVFDAEGHLTSKRDPLGKVTQYEYDEGFNRIRTVDPTGAVTRARYDGKKNVVELTGRSGEVYRFQYEPGFNRLTEIVDPLGNRTRMTYDGRGNLVGLSDPLNRTTTYSYDTRGLLRGVTNSKGQTTEFAYDAHGNVTSITDPSGAVTRFTYDGLGHLLTMTDPLGKTTRLEYDGLGRVLRVQEPTGAEHRYTYDADGHVLSYVDPSGAVYTWSYDPFGRVVQYTDPLGQVQRFQYDAGGKLLAATDPLNRTFRYAYDAAGRLTRATNPAGEKTRYAYDELGRLRELTDALGRSTELAYDPSGRPVRVEDPSGGVMEYEYDPLGRLIRRVDPGGNLFRWTYDAAGQLVEEESPQGRIRYTYDPLGNVATRTDLAGRTTRFAYDARGLLTEIVYPDETVRFAYDAAGRMTLASNPALSERYAYDAMGRLIEVQNLTLNKTLRTTYDARGLRTSLTDPEGRVFRYAYNPLGRLEQFTGSEGQRFEFSYDALARLERVRHPNQVETRYGYDVAGRLASLVTGSPFEEILRYTYRYDAVGNPLERGEGGGAVSRYAYDLLDRLVRVEYPLEAIEAIRAWQDGTFPPGKGLSQGATSYPLAPTLPVPPTRVPSLPEGEVVEAIPQAPGTSEGRQPPSEPPGQGGKPGGGRPDDPGGAVSWPDPFARASYTYDRVGNRLTLQTDAGILPYTYGTLNRLLRAGVVTYRYDANGNVVERADQEKTIRYTYDSRNQLTRVDFPDGTWVRYAYDAFGRRVYREESYWQNAQKQKTEITHYLYDGLDVLMEYAGTPGEGLPPLAEYYRANGQLLARKMFGFHGRKAPGNEEFLRTRGGLLFYHTDALGSVQALTDRKGEVVVQYSYEVFGQVWAGVMGPYNRYAFTGKEYDPKTGLYYFGARWYDPEVGRWASQDLVRDGLNWYVYVDNRPTALVDPLGLFKVDPSGQWGTVEPGDTLSGIARKVYGDASLYTEIVRMQPFALRDPDLIYPGQEILLPRTESYPQGYDLSNDSVRADWLTPTLFVIGAATGIQVASSGAAAGVAVRVYSWIQSRLSGTGASSSRINLQMFAKKGDIRQVEQVARKFKMTPEQRRAFGDFIEEMKDDITGGRDLTWKQLEALARQFLEGY
ncbi:DUF6531 domain-containing protein [Limnochorda pilosa]|uniref:LysM domain-containing protein n=1 Tax=Limnochorda pilosa TaxID=1555112 RepID=A0A0K2SIZ5_LIMPI|nr:DUF6531 domain-containing protein [Limnochorda pilosa]BAS27096.1 hypothetical protein LIP_1239 [Limnochorda pilosa]